MKIIRSISLIFIASACFFYVIWWLCLPASASDNADFEQICFEDAKTHNITTSILKNEKNRRKSTTSEETDGEYLELVTTPEEYGDFIDSLPSEVIDALPEGALSGNAEELSEAASALGSITALMGAFLDAFGSSLTEVIPTLTTLFGIIMLSAVGRAVAENSSSGLGGAVSFASRICSFSVISACSVAVLDRLEGYFDSLFGAVTAFVPLNGVLLAMGGNLTGAASTSATLTLTLSVCEAVCAKTVIPVFCLCLSLTVITVFEGQSAAVGQSASGAVKKWYTTVLGFIMMIMTVSSLSQGIISSKADNAAMRGAKFAAGSFIPVSGGALSSTLGTLSASVELLRSSVGVIGISVVMLMLIPTIVELALLRGVFSLASFASGMLGCSGEQRLLGEIGSLYGFLEGVAALSSAIFLISFAIFAATSSALG